MNIFLTILAWLFSIGAFISMYCYGLPIIAIALHVISVAIAIYQSLHYPQEKPTLIWMSHTFRLLAIGCDIIGLPSIMMFKPAMIFGLPPSSWLRLFALALSSYAFCAEYLKKRNSRNTQ